MVANIFGRSKIKPKFYTGAVFGDAHAPYHDKQAVNVLCKILSDVKPDVVINLGDWGEFKSLSSYDEDKPLEMENQRILKDIESVWTLDDMVFSAVPPKTRKIRMIGNHEERIERYIAKNARMEGLLPDFKHGIKGKIDPYKGYNKTVPHARFHVEGKLMFHHGDRKGYQSIHHAKQWATMGKNIVYGHRHDVQRFTHEKLSLSGRPECNAAFSIGCLCEIDRDWRVNQRTTWQQGFGIFHILENGMFSFYHVDIIKGHAVWNGKVY